MAWRGMISGQEQPDGKRVGCLSRRSSLPPATMNGVFLLNTFFCGIVKGNRDYEKFLSMTIGIPTNKH